MSKPTVHDIARAAGVSLATVDRVLNARPGVRGVTVEKVRAAVDSLGYVRDVTAANLARQRQYRFTFLLPDGQSQFHASLRRAAAEAGRATDRTTLVTRVFDEGDDHAAARELALLGPERTDGVAIMAPETPQLRDAVAHLRAQGLPVVAFVSDLPNSGCDDFVGINNRAAGRTAATLLGRFAARRDDEIVVVANSLQARDSLERRLGFDAVMAEDFPAMTVLPTIESHGDAERLTRMLDTLLRQRPRIGGIYSLATGTKALVQAVEGHRAGGIPAVVVHELTPFAREALIRRSIDAVITQDVGHLARSALRILRARCDGLPTIAEQERIRIEVILRENLP